MNYYDKLQFYSYNIKKDLFTVLKIKQLLV